jgi:hypothetical protein
MRMTGFGRIEPLADTTARAKGPPSYAPTCREAANCPPCYLQRLQLQNRQAESTYTCLIASASMALAILTAITAISAILDSSIPPNLPYRLAAIALAMLAAAWMS